MPPTIQCEKPISSLSVVAILIRNISITEEAGRLLRRSYGAFRPRPGDTFGLLFVEDYFYSNGATVEGFRPGYKAGPVTTQGGFDEHWALAQLSDGLEFYFMPQFVWDSRRWYIVDRHAGRLVFD
jgi:hypothetical protein